MAIDLNDKTTNGNTLTNHGATEVSTNLPFAASTTAVDLSAASSQYLDAADSASLSVTGSFTIEAWVKFTSTPSSGNQMVIVSKYDDAAPKANQRSYFFSLHNNGSALGLRLLGSSNGSSVDTNVRVNWTPSTGVWYHVAVTYTTTPVVKFYVDGSQQGTDQTPTGTAIFDSTANLALGTYNTASTIGSLLDGKLDEVRIWNVVRTQTQINDNKSVELIGNESGLVAYYPFEATIATTTSTTTSTTTTSTSSSTSTTTTSTSSSTSSSTTTTSTSTTHSTSTTTTSTSSSTTTTSTSTTHSTSTSTTTTSTSTTTTSTSSSTTTTSTSTSSSTTMTVTSTSTTTTSTSTTTTSTSSSTTTTSTSSSTSSSTTTTSTSTSITTSTSSSTTTTSTSSSTTTSTTTTSTSSSTTTTSTSSSTSSSTTTTSTSTSITTSTTTSTSSSTSTSTTTTYQLFFSVETIEIDFEVDHPGN